MSAVSVIIPTNNRSQYAIKTIKSLLLSSNNIEVIISDSSLTDEISGEFPAEIEGGRIIYLKSEAGSSVVDNFNYALHAAKGNYIIYIGDDDLVSSRLEDVANWAETYNVDAVQFSFPALFYWDDFVSNTRWKAVGSTVVINDFTGSVQKTDPKVALLDALNNFGGGVLDMPRVYAGMISRKLALEICKKHGKLFGGVSPDIYSAALISMESKSCYSIDFPVVIPGASGNSGSGLSAKGKHIGKLFDNPYMAAFKSLQWDNKIPEFYSVYTVWAYSLLKAVEKNTPLFNKINFLRLYVKCLANERGYENFTLYSFKEYLKNTSTTVFFRDFTLAFFGESSLILRKIFKKIRNLAQRERQGHTKTGINDSLEAYSYIEKYLMENNFELTLPKLDQIKID